MGKITGFLEIERHDRKYAPVAERVKHFHEFVVPLSEKDPREMLNEYDAVALTGGAEAPRDLSIPGRDPKSPLDGSPVREKATAPMRLDRRRLSGPRRAALRAIRRRCGGHCRHRAA
ncbi:hypothetical protein [Bradyrhizobium sp. sGM-13]|uniref:hypothetical protein n=1 Tax=Bradyrhizobium sp. sGM-13 TaxID=2831781 RepID=UPI001BCCD8C7|nr:hypothetical protein [Bradyrhizobium sp. sGM-13]